MSKQNILDQLNFSIKYNNVYNLEGYFVYLYRY